jgi:hypothetical protein
MAGLLLTECAGEKSRAGTRKQRGGGWAGPKERREGEKRDLGFLFFKLLFKLYKLHSNKHKTMHSNYDAQALIDSKIIEMIFKYLKAKFI